MEAGGEELVKRHLKKEGFQGYKEGGLSCPSTMSTVVRICRPKLISRLKDDVTITTTINNNNILQTSSHVLTPPHPQPPLSSTVRVAEVLEEFLPSEYQCEARPNLPPQISNTGTISPAFRTCRPKLISTLKNPPMTGRDDTTTISPSSEPPFLSSRPKIIKDGRKFPIKQIVQNEKDRGRNCVSVILKSSSSGTPGRR